MNICLPGACICDAREWVGDTNCMGEIECDRCCGEHVPNACPAAQYVRVEVSEGRAYTYTSDLNPPLQPGEWVTLPGNEVHKTEFAGKVLRLLDGPDKHYSGPYKAVIGRLHAVRCHNCRGYSDAHESGCVLAGVAPADWDLL